MTSIQKHTSFKQFRFTNLLQFATADFGVLFTLFLCKVPHAAVVALEYELFHMALGVHLPISFSDELLVAEFALIILLTGMNFDMGSQAALVVELFATLFVWTSVLRDVAHDLLALILRLQVQFNL
jgi:hypothetical protein